MSAGWLIKFLIGIIAIVFIFYFGYSFTSNEGVKVAEVNGEIISGVEYQDAYRNILLNLQTEYQNVWSDNLIEAFNLGPFFTMTTERLKLYQNVVNTFKPIYPARPGRSGDRGQHQQCLSGRSA